MSGYVTTNPTYYNMKHDRKNQRPTHQIPRHHIRFLMHH
jgi:hypothetical protein